MQPPEKVGNVMYVVADMDAAVQFYGEVMGLTLKFRDGDRFASFDGGGVTFALVSGEEDLTGGSPAASFKVNDVHEAVESLRDAGAIVGRGPEEGPHEIRALLYDLAGNPFVLYSAKPKPDA